MAEVIPLTAVLLTRARWRREQPRFRPVDPVVYEHYGVEMQRCCGCERWMKLEEALEHEQTCKRCRPLHSNVLRVTSDNLKGRGPGWETEPDEFDALHADDSGPEDGAA